MRVAALQQNLHWENPEANKKDFLQNLSALKHVDLAVLPEMFSTGFSMKPEHCAHTESEVQEYLQDFQTLANEKNMSITGSLMVKESHKYYNKLYLLRPKMAPLSYAKKHLFTFAGEHKHYTAGHQKLISEIGQLRCAFFICYDLRFPVWIRNTKSNPYDFAVFVANWPEARIQAWISLLKARAIENQCYVLGVNRVGTDGNDIVYSGFSALINPYGVVEVYSEKKECTLTGHVDLSKLQAFREKFPVLNDADDFTLH